MPHLHLAYSDNLSLDAATVLPQLAQALHGSGLFAEADIKSRASAHADYLVGTGDRMSAHAHVTVWVLGGRDEATRSALAQQVLAALQQALGTQSVPVQLTVDVREMNRAVYAKALI